MVARSPHLAQDVLINGPKVNVLRLERYFISVCAFVVINKKTC